MIGNKKDGFILGYIIVEKEAILEHKNNTKYLIDKLKYFNIITSITNMSGCNRLSIIVTKSMCNQYPNQLKELQTLLNNQKEVEWDLTVNI